MHTWSRERAKEQSLEGGVVNAEQLVKRVPETPKVIATPKARTRIDIMESSRTH